jgi:serine/threonine protein kinase
MSKAQEMIAETEKHISNDALREPSSAVIRAGDVIDGKYLVGECIAWGGMGIVTDATHMHLQKAVALKCVRPELLEDEEMVARFLNEARIAANLRNEHVARVLDFGKTEAGIPYLVMERLEGMSLAALVMQRGALPVPEAVDYLLQACEALAEAHAQGIVHRDIKPENLFLTQGVDGTPILKVLDFGISKQLSPDIGRMLTNPSSSMGSPCYMSPEQMRNARLVDTRTDIWAMGAVLFDLLAAQPPFDGDSFPEICAHVLCDLPQSLKELRPDLPRGLEEVVLCCLEKDRDKRFADVAEFARALAKYASPDGRASVPSIEHVRSNSEPPHSAERRRPIADSSISFAPTLLEQSTSWSEARMPPDDAADARITHIPGERPRWAWLLSIVVVFAGAGAGAARYLGYDVLRPLRGMVIPGSLREDAPDVLPVRRMLEPQFPSKRGPAHAERERDAPSLATADPAPSPPAQTPPPGSEQRNASTAAETPHAPPALPPSDDPYGVPSEP